jgi:hypothetical protein
MPGIKRLYFNRLKESFFFKLSENDAMTVRVFYLQPGASLIR